MVKHESKIIKQILIALSVHDRHPPCTPYTIVHSLIERPYFLNVLNLLLPQERLHILCEKSQFNGTTLHLMALRNPAPLNGAALRLILLA